jgi:hypothetical protein
MKRELKRANWGGIEKHSSKYPATHILTDKKEYPFAISSNYWDSIIKENVSLRGKGKSDLKESDRNDARVYRRRESRFARLRE